MLGSTALSENAVLQPERDALEQLVALTLTDMDRVDALIRANMQSDVGTIPDLAGYLIEAGGKRLRPMITLAAARMLGFNGDHHIRLATVVEFIHTATLLHDDVVDGSDLRRGRKAAARVWGNAASVLVGDFLFARSFNLMVATGSLDVLDVLSKASSVIAEGEVQQLQSVERLDLSIEEYGQIIMAKTATLFSAAAEVAAIISDAPAASRAALCQYGLELGLAFQLVDDALDYGGVEGVMGKKTGDDFREGKVTLPAALAISKATPQERLFWRDVIEGGRRDDGALAEAIDLLKHHGTLQETLHQAAAHARRAESLLEGFPQTPERDALAALGAFVVSRAR
jgi:octaprenyl-diphosphate synthase